MNTHLYLLLSTATIIRERSSVLRYSYIVCLLMFIFDVNELDINSKPEVKQAGWNAGIVITTIMIIHILFFSF